MTAAGDSSSTETVDDAKSFTVKNITVLIIVLWHWLPSYKIFLQLQKVKRRRTNAASKTLGLSVLLDPTLHDLVDGRFAFSMFNVNNIESFSRI